MEAGNESAGERIARLHTALLSAIVNFQQFEQYLIDRGKPSGDPSALVDRLLPENRKILSTYRLLESPNVDFPQIILRSRRALLGDHAQDDPAAQAYLSPNPTRYIAENFLRTHAVSLTDVELLEQVQESFQGVTEAMNSRRMVVAVLAGFALVAKLVPKEVFAYFGIRDSYNLYQVVTTGIALLAVAAIGIVWLATHRRFSKRRLASAMFTDVILQLKIAIKAGAE